MLAAHDYIIVDMALGQDWLGNLRVPYLGTVYESIWYDVTTEWAATVYRIAVIYDAVRSPGIDQVLCRSTT